jgi:thiamine-phosphate pyrophosphorylase
MRERLAGLYVIIDPEVAYGRDEVEIAREAIAGGASMIQLRDKSWETGPTNLSRVQAIAGICRSTGTLFIVNDRTRSH